MGFVGERLAPAPTLTPAAHTLTPAAQYGLGRCGTLAVKRKASPALARPTQCCRGSALSFRWDGRSSLHKKKKRNNKRRKLSNVGWFHDFRHYRQSQSHELLWFNRTKNKAASAWVDAQHSAYLHVGMASPCASDTHRDSTPWRVARDSRDITAGTVSKLCREGRLAQAVEALELLVLTGPPVPKSLLQTVVKKCVAHKDLALACRLRAVTVKQGYQSDTFLGFHFLRMYAAHGRLQDAMEVFDAVASPDVFTWSAIMSAYVKHGQDKQAIQIYRRMRVTSNVKPDGHVFVAALQACARALDLKTGYQVHADVLGSGSQPALFVSNCLLTMYTKCGSLKNAQTVFDGLGEKDVVTWNALIAGYAHQGMGQQAFRLYTEMQEGGMAEPNSVTFVCLLQACASVGTAALDKGKHLHAQITEQGHQADVFIANSLVNMYAKCGSLNEAQGVFDGLHRKDVVTWNAMIAGYSQQGMGQEAFRLYSAMLQEGKAAPNAVTFVCLLRACASLGTVVALEKGKHLHAKIREHGHEADVFVANSLVNMYAKCDSLEDAQGVFDGLAKKDVVTWNAMIGGYSRQGVGEKALHLYAVMVQEGITAPNSMTFVCLLQACASVGTTALEKGKLFHAQVREQGHQTDVFVANSLVNMYAKCGSLDDAQSVFDGLGQKDVVAWNALIVGYVQHGMGQEALNLFSAMQDEGVAVPDSRTFVHLLQACASMGNPGLEKGRQLHVQITECACRTDVFVGCSLVNMYAKCGSLEDAQTVFDGLDHKDVVTWTAMIAGYTQLGMGQEAIRLYSAMQEEGLAVCNSVTFVCLLQACAKLGPLALETGKHLHAQVREGGHDTDVFVANSLVNMYAKCGSLEDAQRLFDGLCQRDVVTWNALISGYAQHGMGQEALRLYSDMQDIGMTIPDSVTFVCLLQACASLGTPALETGKQLHAQIIAGGHEGDVSVANSLVNMYAKCGSLEHAQTVFDGLGQKDVVTWTAMIAGYSQQGMGQAALGLYSAMQEYGVAVPNSVTFVCLLDSCGKLASLSSGRQLHAQILEQGLQADLCVAGSLINMYGRSGSMVDAQQVFDSLPNRDVVVWNALIAGYACHGESDIVFDLVRRMRVYGIEPDGITSLSVLTMCSHVGLLNKGKSYFEAMSRYYGITATEDHYACIVDLIGRAGQLDEALALVRAMPVQPNAAIWHTLLGACQKWSNVEVGQHAFNEALKQDVDDGAAYVLMTNIYTGAQMWEQAQKTQVRRKRMRAWKQPGQSWWTDSAGVVHSFVVEDEKPSSTVEADICQKKDVCHIQTHMSDDPKKNLLMRAQ